MPVYPVKVNPNNFRDHLPPGAVNGSSVSYEPAQLQFPGDVEALGAPHVIEGIGSLQSGKLLISVTATFHDGHEVTFPVNTRVKIYLYDDDDHQSFIMLAATEAGEPILVPIVAAGPGAGSVPGAGTRRGGRRGRRSTRRNKRRSTRRSRKH